MSDTIPSGIWQVSYSTRILGSGTGSNVTGIQAVANLTSGTVATNTPASVGSQGLTAAMTTAAATGPANIFISGSGTMNLTSSSVITFVIYVYWNANQPYLAGTSESYLMCTRIA